MTTFAVTDPAQTLDAVNYVISNLGQVTGNANVTIPSDVLVANLTTNAISTYGSSANVLPQAWSKQYINLRYANASDGSAGFNDNPANSQYFGMYNSVTSTPSNNPNQYSWYEAAGGFGTANIIYYATNGGRQIQISIGNIAPAPFYEPAVVNVAIDLDVVTTGNGTPGPRGPIAMAYVVAPSNPTPGNVTSATLTTWFSSSRDAVVPPIGTGLTPVTGDTSNFSYVSGNVAQDYTYQYNGTVWTGVTGQVISGNVIVPGTLFGNTIVANTIAADQLITGNLTTTNFTANTINGNILTLNTITANLINVDGLTVNSVQSQNATIGNANSVGTWIQANTGSARFGNTVSIGNSLTVGNNAVIGGNLTVSGLVTSGNLVSNSVITTTIVPDSVSAAASYTVAMPYTFAANATPSTVYTLLGPTIVATSANTKITVSATGGWRLALQTTSGPLGTLYGTLTGSVRRWSGPTTGPGAVLYYFTIFFTQAGIQPSPSFTYQTIPAAVLPTIIDTVNAGNVTYGWGVEYSQSFTSGNFTRSLQLYNTLATTTATLPMNIYAQQLKR